MRSEKGALGGKREERREKREERSEKRETSTIKMRGSKDAMVADRRGKKEEEIYFEQQQLTDNRVCWPLGRRDG